MPEIHEFLPATKWNKKKLIRTKGIFQSFDIVAQLET